MNFFRNGDKMGNLWRLRMGRMDNLFIGIICIVLKDVLDSSDVTSEKYCVFFNVLNF